MNDRRLELSLVHEERIGDALFLLGTILAFIANYQAEQALITTPEAKPLPNQSAYTITLASWLFFLSSILFTHVAIIRWMELKSTRNSKTSPVLIKGTKWATIGNILKSVGFGLAAIGYQLKASD